jgi:hypothetical protein
MSGPVELTALSVKGKTIRCSRPGENRIITFRHSRVCDVVPGEIVTILPAKHWHRAGQFCLSGDIQSTRLDVAALGLKPLRLEYCGDWDPGEEYWGEEGDPIEDWAKPIISRGPRPEFEMEQVLPGEDIENDHDPITDSNDLKDAGDRAGARAILMELCEVDLRCLDAHAHLGNFIFESNPGKAIRHYEVGLRIGERSLAEGFDGLLPWGLVDNRPFLRCMHGFGLCLWRLERLDDAGRVFERMLWLNPSDNQGARFLLPSVRSGETWKRA